MVEDNGYLVDSTNKVLLKKVGQMPSPRGCDNTIIYTTEYPDLFLVPTGHSWPKMERDVNLNDFISARDDYIMWELEQKIKEHSLDLRQKICERGLQGPQDDTVHVRGSNFIRRNGDTVEHFECSPRTGRLQEDATDCYDDIPILLNNEEPGFIRPSSRQLIGHSAPRPCNNHYGSVSPKLYLHNRTSELNSENC